MRLEETRQIDRPLEEVFAFTADFANAEKWDPGVSTSRRVGNGPARTTAPSSTASPGRPRRWR